MGYVCADNSMFGSKQKTIMWECRLLRNGELELHSLKLFSDLIMN